MSHRRTAIVGLAAAVDEATSFAPNGKRILFDRSLGGDPEIAVFGIATDGAPTTQATRIGSAAARVDASYRRRRPLRGR